MKKNTEFFSTFDPDTLMTCLNDYVEGKGAKLELSKTKYKAKVNLVTEDDTVGITVRILKTKDGKFCVEFNRTAGDQFNFFNTFEEIRDFYDELHDAVLN